MSDVIIPYRYTLRGGTAAAVAALNEIPKARELIFETDTGKCKLGDGVTHYNSLAYLFQIADNSITYAKMQDISATKRVLGRNTAGAGDPEEVTLSQLLDWVGSAANGDLLIRSGGAWTRLPKSTDGKVLTLASGLPSWAASAGGAGASYTPPISTDFTAFGTGLTVSDKTGRMVFEKTSTTTLAGILQNVPSAPYTLDTYVGMVSAAQSNSAVITGLCLSDGTKFRTFYAGQWGSASTTDNSIRMSVDSFTNSSTFLAQVRTQNVLINPSNYHLRITDNATTRTFLLSENGLDFVPVYSEASGTFVVPTKVGVCVFNGSQNSVVSKSQIWHWLPTASILGDAA